MHGDLNMIEKSLWLTHVSLALFLASAFTIALPSTGCVDSRSIPVSALSKGTSPTCHDITPLASISAADPVSNKSFGSDIEADRLMRQGAADYSHGQFGQAAQAWDRAATHYAAARRDADQCDALIDLSAAYESLGSFQESAQYLAKAYRLATGLRDVSRQTAILDALGTVYTFMRQFPEAEAAIAQGLRLAGQDGDNRVRAGLLNNRGNLLAVEGHYDPAAESFAQAAQAAARAGDGPAEARALTNEALALLQAEKVPDAAAINRQARAATVRLNDCHDKAGLFVTQGRTFYLSGRPGSQDRLTLIAEARESYADATRVAQLAEDRVTLSYALGYQGEIAEAENRRGDALALSRRAMFIAQEAGALDALYRWQWQVGRLLRDSQQIDAAIDAYGNAIDTLTKIHGDLAQGFGNAAGANSFRDSVGPVYYEMADLLLQRADATQSWDEVQRLLLRARNTVEQLKSGELEDYFQKKCVNLIDRRAIDAAEPGTAVVYLIPLPDRMEMLISTSAGMTRVKSAVGADALTIQVREFRTRLEDRTSNRFLKNSRKLYDWIIRPIEPILAAQHIDTLVFVPDGALRTIPMAALNDGKDFLITKYAIAITPGLTLMGTPPGIDGTSLTVLEGGISQSVARFPALDFVPQELRGIHQLYGGVELLNGAFTKTNLTGEMRDRKFTIVHLASHAEFSHDRGGTFLLTYPEGGATGDKPSAEGRLTLAELGVMLNPSRYRDQPVELLALSACQTAAGDDRAALGLAGIALEMGARSAVATLWSVNDQASAELVQGFYTALRADVTLSKAKAMQRAQVALIRDVRYRHPCYWAPYLVIGNWKPLRLTYVADAQGGSANK